MGIFYKDKLNKEVKLDKKKGMPHGTLLYEELLDALYECVGETPSTTKDIWNRLNDSVQQTQIRSWHTANKYLQILVERGLIKSMRIGRYNVYHKIVKR